MKTYFRNLIICFCLMPFAVTAQNNDIAVTQITSPISGCNLSCVNPKITIYNNTPPLPNPVLWSGNYEVCYTVNGGPAVCEYFSVPNLNNGATYDYTFIDTMCFATQGTYTLVVTVNLVAPYPASGPDVNMANNTSTIVIINDTTVVPGTLSQSDSVCSGINSGILTLTGNTGYIDFWESSINNGNNWDSIPNLSNSQSYSNLTQQTIYHVHLDGGFCPDSWSQWAVITPVLPPVPGTAVGAATVCATSNAGIVSLSGFTGTIVDWIATDVGGPAPVGNANPYAYNNLTNTTTYYAVVSNGGHCPDQYSSQVTITVTPSSVGGNVTSDATVCAGNNGGTLALVGNTGNVLNWVQIVGVNPLQPLGNTTTFQAYSNLVTTTQYYAVVKNGICPADTSGIATITVMPAPTVFAGNDTALNLGDVLTLNGTGALIYTWSPPAWLSATGIFNPDFTAGAVGTFTYTLTGQDAFGCTNTDQITIIVRDTVTVFPPVVANFITPNGDGLNDVWNVMNIGSYPDNEVIVYNNHGQEVFSKASYNNDWKGTYNGNQLPDGSYYYVVKINNIDRTFKGVVTITDTQKP